MTLPSLGPPLRPEEQLAAALAPTLRRARRARLVTTLALTGAGAALVALFLRWLEEARGFDLAGGWVVFVLATAAIAVALWRRAADAADEPRRIARLIEAQDPALRALLLTAVAQAPPRPGARLGYLQEQLVEQALAKADPERWSRAVSGRRLGALTAASAGAGVIVAYCALTGLFPDLPSVFDDDVGLRVSPGDTEAERGTRVLVLARFAQRLPATAELVVRVPGQPPVRVPMRRNFEDPVFGAMTPALPAGQVDYFVEHDGGRSPRYQIRVFAAPDLERLDARIEYPRQPSLPAREVPEARFLSVSDGARITLTARVPAPARKVRLVGEGESIDLRPEGDRRFVAVLTPARTRRYDVVVEDERGRKNPTPPRLSIEVHRNLPAEIKLAFPGRDVRVSPLEELTVEAKISDDTAVVAHGLAYRLSGQKTMPWRELRLGAGGGRTAVQARAQIELETLAAAPGQLLIYHFWAEDHDGAGKLRRNASDMYFAEVRPFEERFREAPAGGGEEPGEEGEGGETADLVRRQKDIINATWRLERQAREDAPPAPLGKDAAVVATGQGTLAGAAEELRGRARDARTRATLDLAVGAMKEARRALDQVAGGPKTSADAIAPLGAALEAQQRAYAALLRLRDPERNVGRSRGGGGGAGEEALAGLELKQKESRYETRREARSPRRPHRPDREALARLEELARRQAALTERLKEATLALEQQAAADEAEAARRLKRLREEQQEMMEDLDRLAQRLAEPGTSEAANQAQAEARRALDGIRQEAAAAAEALARGEPERAVGASTRAERALAEARSGLARKVAAGFDEEMRKLRDAARALDERQRKIAETLGPPPAEPAPGAGEVEPGRGPGAGALVPAEPPSPTEARRLASELRQQRTGTGELLGELERLSRETETGAPLLSRKLYDGLRDAKLADVEGALGTAGELFERNLADEARAAEGRARRALGELRTQVDDAAKGLLGDEAEALRAAQTELDGLIAEAGREGKAPSAAPPGKGSGRAPGQSRDQPAGEGGTGSGPSEEEGPITGGAFRPFVERLRDVEDLLDDSRLRNEVAGVRDRVRALRADWKARGQRPSRALLEQQVLGPLTELRTRLALELARLERNDRLVPLDRDPIPSRYGEVVRRYWKSLSEGR